MTKLIVRQCRGVGAKLLAEVAKRDRRHLVFSLDAADSFESIFAAVHRQAAKSSAMRRKLRLDDAP